MTRNTIFDEILPVVLRNPANTPNQKHNFLHRDYLLRLLKLVIALRALWKHISSSRSSCNKGVVAIKEQSAVLKGVMCIKVFQIFLGGKTKNKGGNVSAEEQQGAM